MGEVISSSQSFTQTRQELVKVPAFFSFRSHSPDFDKMCTYKITYPNFQAFSKNNLCKWVTQRLFFVSLHHVCT